MNILLSTWSLEVGGAEILAMNLAAKLAEKNHKIFIFNQSEDKVDYKLISELLPASVKIYSMNSWPVFNYFIWKINGLAKRLGVKFNIHQYVKTVLLRRLVKLERIDIVSSHSTHSDKICAQAFKSLKIPLVITEHGEYCMFLYQGKEELLSPLKTADLVIAVSNFCKNTLQKYFNNESLITTIYNGVRILESGSRMEVRNMLGIREDEIVFGFAARGIKEKGWEQAIQAFIRLQMNTTKRFHLLLIGGSNYVDSLKQEFKEIQNLHFIGQVANPGFFIEATDVGLLLSSIKTEALSLSAIEFLAFGKPVIASNVGGVPEVLNYKGRKFGELIDLDEDGSINMAKLIFEMQKYIRGDKHTVLNKEISDLTKQRFSLDLCADQYEEVFLTQLNKKGL